MVAKHQMKNRKLSLQALEDRNMFAVDSFIKLVGTELIAGGDAMDNQMVIEEMTGIPNPEALSSLAEPAPTTAVFRGIHEFKVPVSLFTEINVTVASGSTLRFNNALNLNGNTLNKSGDGNVEIRNDFITGTGGMINVHAGVVSGNGTVGGNVNNYGGTISPGWQDPAGHGLDDTSVKGRHDPEAGTDVGKIPTLEDVHDLAEARILGGWFPMGIRDPDAINSLDEAQILDKGFHLDNSLAEARILGGAFPEGTPRPEFSDLQGVSDLENMSEKIAGNSLKG